MQGVIDYSLVGWICKALELREWEELDCTEAAERIADEFASGLSDWEIRLYFSVGFQQLQSALPLSAELFSANLIPGSEIARAAIMECALEFIERELERWENAVPAQRKILRLQWSAQAEAFERGFDVASNKIERARNRTRKALELLEQSPKPRLTGMAKRQIRAHKMTVDELYEQGYSLDELIRAMEAAYTAGVRMAAASAIHEFVERKMKMTG